jgi:hypothetical protein
MAADQPYNRAFIFDSGMVRMGKSEPEDTADKARRKHGADEKKRLEREKEVQRLKELLAEAEAAVDGLQQAETGAHARAKALAALVSHAAGFYEEVDKLAKGKALFAATDLAVQQVNDIIRDAKAIVEDDPHLARVKEFVPAGDNPLYPDILLVTRAVQQCLTRCTNGIETREKETAKALREGKTIAVGLRIWSDSGRQPTKDDVQKAMGTKPLDAWFFAAENGSMLMDVVRLLREGLPKPKAIE